MKANDAWDSVPVLVLTGMIDAGFVLIWIITLMLYQILLWSLDIQVPFVATLTLLVFLQVGVRLPSSPGSIGVFHYLCVVALSFFGVTKSVALSYGLLLHLVTFLPTSLLGLLYLSRKGYSLGRLRQAAEISAAGIERRSKDGVPL